MHEKWQAAPEYPSDRESARLLTDLFVQRFDCFPLQRPDGSYRTVHRPLRIRHVDRHLRGEITLGAYLLSPTNTVRFLVLDADNPDQWQALRAMSQTLSREGVPSYVEQSRRGGHLWFFFPLVVSGDRARQFGLGLAASFALGKIEVYPKQSTLEKGPGSLIRLPFGVHRKTGQRYLFSLPDGTSLGTTPSEQLRVLRHAQTVNLGMIEHFQVVVPKPTKKPIVITHSDSEGHVSERVKRAISVYDFVGQYVVLSEAGLGKCPFHDDTVHSFSVNQKENYWNCFAGCGGGSIIDFWMRYRACDFKTAVRELAAQLL